MAPPTTVRHSTQRADVLEHSVIYWMTLRLQKWRPPPGRIVPYWMTLGRGGGRARIASAAVSERCSRRGERMG
jgi:hypothetical protein